MFFAHVSLLSLLLLPTNDLLSSKPMKIQPESLISPTVKVLEETGFN